MKKRFIDSWRGFHTPPLWGGHKVWNPRPIPYENNIPRCSAAGYVDTVFSLVSRTICAKIKNFNHGDHGVTRSFKAIFVFSSVKLRVLCGYFYVFYLLFFFPFVIYSQTRTDVPYLVPQTIFVGDSGRLVVPLGRAFSRIKPFILDVPEKLPETPELLIRRLELEHRSGGGGARLLIDFIPYAAGILTLPDLEISSQEEGTEPLVLSGMEVQVASILNPSQMSLSGPATPIAVPGTSFLIYGTIIIFILLLCLGIGISLWGRRHFKDLWELFRRRRLIGVMVKFLRCLRQECSFEKEGDPGYYLTLLSKEFREFLSLFTGINCRSLTPGEFLGLPLSQKALALGPVYLSWLFQTWETLRFSGKRMEMAEMLTALDEIERLIAALEKEEREKSLPKSLGMPETASGEGV